MQRQQQEIESQEVKRSKQHAVSVLATGISAAVTLAILLRRQSHVLGVTTQLPHAVQVALYVVWTTTAVAVVLAAAVMYSLWPVTLHATTTTTSTTTISSNQEEENEALLTGLTVAAILHWVAAEWYLYTFNSHGSEIAASLNIYNNNNNNNNTVDTVAEHWSLWFLAIIPCVALMIGVRATRAYHVLQALCVYHSLPLTFSEFSEF